MLVNVCLLIWYESVALRGCGAGNPARQRRISYDVLVSDVNLDYEGNCDIKQMKAAWSDVNSVRIPQ